MDQQRTLQNPTSLGRIDSNRFSETLLPVTAPDIDNGVADFQALERRIRAPQRYLKKMPGAFAACTCHGVCQANQVSRGPVTFSRIETHPHTRHCPYWVPGAGALNATFGLMLCYLALGLKFRMFVALSIGAGTFSITPGLTCHRIVSRSSSPAFTLIESLSGFDRSHIAFREASAELSKIFQTRQASPHDRLANGQTLLHVSARVLPACLLTLLIFDSFCAEGSVLLYGLCSPAS
jgi:hypothetical protein